jgi:hypothetical protein
MTITPTLQAMVVLVGTADEIVIVKVTTNLPVKVVSGGGTSVSSEPMPSITGGISKVRGMSLPYTIGMGDLVLS